MKAAVTVWEDRISPVFDACRQLLVAEIANHKVSRVHCEPMDPEAIAQTAERLSAMGISVLICGAISQRPAFLLEAAGIRLIPFVAGKADPVLEIFAKGQAITPRFSMPGCGRRRRCCESSPDDDKCFNTDSKEVNIMPNRDGTGPKGQGGGRGKGRGRGRGGCAANSGKTAGKKSQRSRADAGKGVRQGNGTRR